MLEIVTKVYVKGTDVSSLSIRILIILAPRHRQSLRISDLLVLLRRGCGRAANYHRWLYNIGFPLQDFVAVPFSRVQ
jgi:hypothetical protein